MPIYEYVCQNCGKDIEILQKITDPAPQKCAKCGQGPLTKRMSLSAFHLKGSGWYSDGYSSTSSKSSSGSSSSGSSTSDTSSPSTKKTSISE